MPIARRGSLQFSEFQAMMDLSADEVYTAPVSGTCTADKMAPEWPVTGEMRLPSDGFTMYDVLFLPETRTCPAPLMYRMRSDSSSN